MKLYQTFVQKAVTKCPALIPKTLAVLTSCVFFLFNHVYIFYVFVILKTWSPLSLTFSIYRESLPFFQITLYFYVCVYVHTYMRIHFNGYVIIPFGYKVVFYPFFWGIHLNWHFFFLIIISTAHFYYISYTSLFWGISWSEIKWGLWVMRSVGYVVRVFFEF